MPAISLIDTSLRDGNQSLWGATGLDTAMMLGIAPVLDRVGFDAVDFTTSTHMAVAVRFHRENPWERIRLMRAAMPDTPLGFLTTGLRFISWETASEEVMSLAFRLLAQAGIRRFAVMEPMNEVAALLGCARLVRQATGQDVVAALTYTVSPIHDDEYFASRAAQLAAEPIVTRLYLKDPGGLLTPERARTLLPALKARLGDKPLELHSHQTIGLAQFTYAEAPALGVSCLHTASAPLANGTSQPSTESTLSNLEVAGVDTALDRQALQQYSDWLLRVADAEGLAPGVPSEYDARHFRHQLPGGMIGTMRRQLRELRQEHRWEQVTEEVARVRAELGYPIMVTPFSQVVGTQAVMNVVGAGRYASVPDQVIRYVLGRFGTPTHPVDPDVADRILSLPRARELAGEPGMSGLDDLRARHGRTLADEELLLRAVMPAEQVDAMLEAGPAARDYNPEARPLMKLLRGLRDLPPAEELRIERPGLRLTLVGGRGAR